MSKQFYEILLDEVPAGYYFAGLGRACKGAKCYDKESGWVDCYARAVGSVMLLAFPDVTIEEWANAQPMLVDLLKFVREDMHGVRLYGDGKHLLISGKQEIPFYAEPCPNKFRAKLIRVVKGKWVGA